MTIHWVFQNTTSPLIDMFLIPRQGAPVPAALVQAGLILFYSVRYSTALQLHLLSWWSSIIMELGGFPFVIAELLLHSDLAVPSTVSQTVYCAGRWIEGAPASKVLKESLLLLLML